MISFRDYINQVKKEKEEVQAISESTMNKFNEFLELHKTKLLGNN
jgi:hypothetical protein